MFVFSLQFYQNINDKKRKSLKTQFVTTSNTTQVKKDQLEQNYNEFSILFLVSMKIEEEKKIKQLNKEMFIRKNISQSMNKMKCHTIQTSTLTNQSISLCFQTMLGHLR